MSRRLGSRFQPDKLQRTVLNGTLTVGPDSRHVEIIRTQTDRGEDVEIHLAGHQNVLEWTEADGVRSSSGAANQNDRLLIERLLFDSPDQFVLAQLRGASYSLVSTTVRPTDAGDDYSGPLWNVVRVAEPDTGPTKKPQSSWRLYYINVSTGLIDKVISESAGQKIVAEFADWTDLRGDKVPAHIRWTTSGQTLMQYDLIGLSHADTRGGNK
ncbi:MAG TPA: hypothetical protein VE961_27190 [Pyrinomonadaceae bacterium]|nr:hypothetical protein [Pyrinomonadaceae bacterium]